ncbi:MAG: beta-Ala-His dipeptidase [Parasporobacterium sp.]|nr:beta-Ala-His dipeptidase [Parasporobacterium sp.]
MAEKHPVQIEFEKICEVPRRSFHNEKIMAYCIKWAEDNGFEYYHDSENGNLIISKAAAPGMENAPGVVLQGHLDMVAAKDEGVEHDFDTEGIDWYIEDDWYKARGTTLGADNGVAPAIAFALFKDPSFKNPPMEILLTTDEEVGMCSLLKADLRCLKGKYLVNLDCGPEGNFVIGCCGGKGAKTRVKKEFEPASGNGYKVVISGLQGGHSGGMIRKIRANAIKLMGQYLFGLRKLGEIRISEVKAEGRDNAISNRMECVFTSSMSQAQAEEYTAKMQEKFSLLYRVTDPDVNITIEPVQVDKVLTKEKSEALGFLLHEIPYGVQYMEQGDLNAIETSDNPGMIEQNDEYMDIVISIRSSVPERIEEIEDRMRDLCNICGAELVAGEKAYPGWMPDYSSPLIGHFTNLYKNMYGEEAVYGAIHAGLECGFILDCSNLEAAIAIGPNATGGHTTQEKLSVSSFLRFYDFVKAAVESIDTI